MSRKLIVSALLGLLLRTESATAMPPDACGFTEAGRWTDGPAGAVVLDGSIAWYLQGTCLAAVDLSEPARPRALASLDLGSGGNDLAAGDGWVYLMSGGELVVIDGRRPARPREVARLAGFGWWGSRLELAGSVLYCASGDLLTIDVSDPTRPRLASRLDGVFARDVAAGGGRVFLAGHYGLVVLDASEPLAPTLLEVVNPGEGWYELVSVQVQGDYLLVGGRSWLWVHESLADDPAASGWWPEMLGVARQAAVHGRDLFVADRVLSRFGPWSDLPSWIDESHCFGPRGLAISGDLLVTTHGSSGLQVWDLAAGDDPVRLATVPAAPTPIALQVVGDRAYAACGFAGLQVFAVPRHGDPEALGNCDDDPAVAPRDRYHAEFVSVFGDQVLVGGVLGLRLVDVRDGTAPRLVRDIRTLPDGSRLRPLSAVAIADGWLVGHSSGGDNSGGLLLVRPGAPEETMVVPVAQPADLALGRAAGDGRLVYAVDSGQSLGVWRVTPADSLQRIGSVATGLPRCQSLAVADGFAYVAAGREIVVIDVRDPTQPRRRGTTGELPWHSNNGITRLAATERMVFADFEWGLGLVDATDPDRPVGYTGNPVYAYSGALAAGDGKACIAGGGSALAVLRAHRAAGALGPAAPEPPLVTVAPNPCNPRTTISFTVPASGPVRVSICDARGRLVLRLHDGRLDGGPQSLDWSGLDEAGRAVATGLYFVRVEMAGGARTTRVAVVR